MSRQDVSSAPTLTQRAFARDLPRLALIGASILACVAVTVTIYLPVLTPGPLDIAWFVFLLIVAAALGLIGGAVVGGLIVAPLYDVRGRLNGAPFRIGDRVQILCGRYRGQTIDVYEVWAERSQVRLTLTESEHDATTDVYFHWQIRRC